MNPRARFQVSQAPPEVQAFIRNLYRGIERYFPKPKVTSWEELKKVLYWKAYDAKRQELEKVWGPRFAALLKASGKRVGVVYAETQSIERCQRSVESQMIPAMRKLLKECDLETERIFLRRLDRSFQQRKDEFDYVVDPMDVDPLITWTVDNVAQKIKNIDSSTKFAISRIINRAVRNGDSISDIVDALTGSFPFSEYRGFLIARTEIISSSNAATHFGMSHFVPPKSLKKDWLATGPPRTRPTHLTAGKDQKDVNYEDPFVVGSSLLMFPGDHSMGASAKEIIQCRCTALYWSKEPLAPPPPTPPPPTPSGPSIPLPRPSPPARPVRRPKPLGETAAAEAEGKALREELEQLFGQEIKELQETAERAMVTHKTWMDMASSLWREGRGPRGEEYGIFQKQRRDLRNRIWGHLALSNPKRSGYRVVFNKASRNLLGSGMEKEIQSAVDLLNSILPGDHKWSNRQIKFHGLKKGERAYATKDGVFLASDAATKTIFHEVGHILEHFDKKLAKGARNHLKKRAGTSALEELRNLFPGSGYDSSEVAWKDKFMHAYMGKFYRHGSTELVSMALEWLWDDPATFMRKDPAMFDRIVGLLRRKKTP